MPAKQENGVEKRTKLGNAPWHGELFIEDGLCHGAEVSKIVHSLPSGHRRTVAMVFGGDRDRMAEGITRACNNYYTLLRQRAELVEALKALIKVYGEDHPLGVWVKARAALRSGGGE